MVRNPSPSSSESGANFTPNRGAVSWLANSEGLKSFVDEPHAAIEGPGQGEIVNLTDHRAEQSRRMQLELLGVLGPDGIAGSRAPRDGVQTAIASKVYCRGLDPGMPPKATSLV